MYSTNRRKFLELFGCGCCGLILTSCAQVPITERRQLRILSEAKINTQAAAVYEQFKSKEKVSLKGSDFERIKNIGNVITKIKKSKSIFIVLTLNNLNISSLNKNLTLELNCVWYSWNFKLK